MATVNPMLERAARAVAGRRIAYDFGFPEEHEVVAMAVDHRWKDYLEEAYCVLRALHDPDDDTVASVVKVQKDRPAAVDLWKAMVEAIGA